MATKLKNLAVTSVDLVDQGANPDAHIQLFKRGENPEDEPTESEKGLFKKFLHWFTKGYEDAHKGNEPKDGVQKDAKMFAEMLDRETMRQITSEMYDFCYALSDSLSSIICDNDLTADSKQAMMKQSLKEFGETMDSAVAAWAQGSRAKVKTETEQAEAAGIQKSTAQQEALAALLEKRGLTEPSNTNVVKNKSEKEEIDTMKIDKSKMTPEELAVLEGLEKKYGAASEPEGNEPNPDGVTKGKEGSEGGEPAPDGVTKGAPGAEPNVPTAGAETLHPEVQKALSDMRAAYAAQTAQVEELKKSLEIERLTQVAKKYEPLGKKSDELAAKFYDLKKAGGTVYDDYVALLDENLTMLGKSRLFGEIGSNRQGSAGTEDTIGIKAAELAKSANGGMTHADAVIKAFEENPELAAQYEQEYMGR